MMFQKKLRGAEFSNFLGLSDRFGRFRNLNKQLKQEITRPKVAQLVRLNCRDTFGLSEAVVLVMRDRWIAKSLACRDTQDPKPRELATRKSATIFVSVKVS